MNASWYCNDCESQIDRGEIETHEAEGHDVQGVVRPDRLLGNDPWNMEIHQGDDPTGSEETDPDRTRHGETDPDRTGADDEVID